MTWEIIYHSKGQHFQLTDRRRKYRYMNYWMLMYFWCRGTLCVWEIRVHCLNEPQSLKSCGVGKFSWKSRSFIILGWSLMTCFSLGCFFFFVCKVSNNDDWNSLASDLLPKATVWYLVAAELKQSLVLLFCKVVKREGRDKLFRLAYDWSCSLKVFLSRNYKGAFWLR